jgi:hypothetical protein
MSGSGQRLSKSVAETGALSTAAALGGSVEA